MSTQDDTPQDPELDIEAIEAAEAEALAEAEEADEQAAENDAEPEADPIAGLQDENDKLRDQLLRALAEAENTKKRSARDVKDARDYAVTGFARDMLDVADNLSRALESLDAETKAAASGFVEGVEMTERRLASAMERHGVKKLEPQPGEPLDPNKHQAAAQIPADQPKGTIAHVMQPGYVIGERTLRAAMVVVSAGPAETPPPTNDGEAGSNLDVSA